MARVLLTGMSGTGKSSVLLKLAQRGYAVVDVDDEGWSDEHPTADGLGREQLWREDRMAALLAEYADRSLFVAGCASNQGRFYDRFDVVVLLSVPVEMLVERLATRESNAFGKDPADKERILGDLAEVEPLLRATATAEIDTPTVARGRRRDRAACPALRLTVRLPRGMSCRYPDEFLRGQESL